MVATFINDPEEVTEDSILEDEELTTFESEDSQEFEEQPEAEVEVEEGVPEKYKGKSMAEIIQMHQEAEKAIGRQGTEVGDLRKIVDDFINTNLESNAQPTPDTPTPVDFWDDPETALSQRLENNQDLKDIKEIKAQLKRNELVAKLDSDHPDWQSTVYNDASFADWVKASKVRMELFHRADNNLDYDAADELLSTWTERKQTVVNTSTIQKEDVKQQRKAASTGSSSGSGEAKSRKVYRRTDIINLMRTDPERYQQLEPEIRQAYAENRVK
jgi:hypothetical protein